MSIDFQHYEGREPAFVKHTFLDKYLPSLAGKISSRFDEFTYVDGFAGPWKSKAGEAFGDTSFGIALNHMTAVRLRYLSRGRNVRMRAILVEKDPQAFSQLKEAVKRFPKVETVAICGEFESHIAEIQKAIPDRSFLFSLIDPKGFPDIEKLLPLLARPNSEALVNFMYDHANRFAETGLIKHLENWLAVSELPNWESELSGLRGLEREQAIEGLAVDGLRKRGAFRYAPVITVDKSMHDRPLYKLIYLTRHSKGLEVFRTSEAKALEAQAKVRTNLKAKKREEVSGMADMFGEDSGSDRSAKVLEEGLTEARALLLEILGSAGKCGRTWEEVWPLVLDQVSVTKSKLGSIVNEARKAGKVFAPEWPSEKHRQPSDRQLLVLS